MRPIRRSALLGLLAFAIALPVTLLPQVATIAAEPFIPRKQSQPPGPPLTPEEAIQRMVVPEGFRVELVAAEPAIMNPVAMAFDDAGRLYVTESFEYPRRSPGPGRDRIKLLEDTDGDGTFDSVKIFAEGLNIPSGIAVGHGGVWVANAPDILFLKDTDGDDVADERQVIATGFGRFDTHELPNALTWGPDGFLYGLNGVFNPGVVEQDGRKIEFTVAMFRIDPVSHRFELFCEGTSNPWGIAFDAEGEAFVSACVIDHLWHLSESGYYHRQAGAYPPHTWKIESIVDYTHQMAAYCGIEYFDSPAYPAEYRNRLYMGNIHGGCINVDSISRSGSTYRGQAQPDFLTANDVWFMPVAQKVGPDGCLYILDWYDRYHCYQDANADPEGIDRGHGRLYRVVHGERPAIEHRDLRAMSDSQLIELLQHANIFYRQRAAVILHERMSGHDEAGQQTHRLLWERLRADPAKASIQHVALALSASPTSLAQVAELFQAAGSDSRVAAWAIRAAGQQLRQIATHGMTTQAGSDAVREIADSLLLAGASHDDPRIRLQTAIAIGKQPADSKYSPPAAELLVKILDGGKDDGLLPRIVWQNLHPHVVANQTLLVDAIASGAASNPLLAALAPRVATRLLADVKPDLSGENDSRTLRSVLHIADVLATEDADESANVLRAVLAKLKTGEIRPNAARETLLAWSRATDSQGPAAIQLRAFAGDPSATDRVTVMMGDEELPFDLRRETLETASLIAPGSLAAAMNRWAGEAVDQRPGAAAWRDALLDAVVSRGDAAAQRALLGRWQALPVGVRARVAGAMVQRESTANLLLGEIEKGNLQKDIIGPNQIRALAVIESDTIRQQVKSIWGTVRLEDAAHRQRIVGEMTQYLLKDARGDAVKGLAVYDRICGQCHQLHGRGYEVGPEITRNGRSNFEQLVVSVFDPSLVIGEAYQSVTVLTSDGRALSGLVLERSAQRIVLKVQGGKTETVPLDEVDEIRQNVQSLMPEGVEEQMTKQEVADLFALLTLEQLPGSPENRTIAGTPEGLHAAP
jgi:putative membrane-bound dehydrogenase-like protein